jgi:hypothetical protein
MIGVKYYPFFSTGGTHLRSDSGLNAFSEGLLNRGDMAMWGSSRRGSTGGGEGVVLQSPDQLSQFFLSGNIPLCVGNIPLSS